MFRETESRESRLFYSVSPPQLAVEGAVLDGFADVVGVDVLDAGEVGNGAGDFQDAVVGAGAQVVLGHGVLEQGGGGIVHGAVGLEFAGSHAGVAGDFGFGGEPGVLEGPGGDDALADLC